MKIQRIDHIGIVVDDIAVAKTFFLDFGFTVQGEAEEQSELLDKVIGLKGAKSHIIFLQAPNNQITIELTKFLNPANEPSPKETFMYSRGIKHIAFAVEDIEAIVATVKQKGWDVIVDVYDYEDIYRLCYFRGPEDIIIELAEKLQNANKESLREISRTIASAVILSSDGKLLMGKKDPRKGGVYPDVWHIPGGGIEPGESLRDAIVREVEQEVVGLDLSSAAIKQIHMTGKGATVKTLDSGEKVWCKMEFNRFEVRLGKTANQLQKEIKAGDDLVELCWFDREELQRIQQIPGGAEFFIEAGYMDVPIK